MNRNSSRTRRWKLAAATLVMVAVLATVSGCPDGSLLELVEPNGDSNGGELPTYTVTYHGNDADSGTVPDAQTKTHGVALTIATNSGNLARTGYTLAGWNTAADGSETDYAEGATYTADADLTLYARWTDLPTYTVTYHANNATSGTVPAPQTKIHGVALALATNSGNLARTGYAFVGWNTQTDGTGTDYAEQASYTTNASVALYAKWLGSNYTVTFDKQDGTGGSNSVVATFGSPMPAATAPSKTGVVFDGYYTGLDGTGTQYYTATMQSARHWDIPADTELIAGWIYEVGDTGPAGGIVFYDKGAYSAGWRYLEAAPASTEWVAQWGDYGTLIGGDAQLTGIGDGQAATNAIVAHMQSASITGTAAQLCAALSHNDYSDWFLPSKDELNQMYLQRGAVGGFASAYYWSSSEDDADLAWRQYFGNGDQFDDGKSYESRVRAVRAF